MIQNVLNRNCTRIFKLTYEILSTEQKLPVNTKSIPVEHLLERFKNYLVKVT